MMNHLPQILYAADGEGGSGAPSGPSSSPPSSPAPATSSPAPTTTPSATPSPQLPAPTGGLKDSSPEATDLFANLGSTDDLDNLIDPALLSSGPAATTVTSTQSLEQPTPVPAPAGPTPQPAATAGPAPQPQPQPTQPRPQQPEPSTQAPEPPVNILEELEANKDALLLALADQEFTLNEDDLASFAEDPNEVLPHLAAKIYYMGVVHSAKQIQSIMSQMPQMFERFLQTRQSNDKAENAFFSMWPKLPKTDEKVRDLVLRTAVAYRNANPKLSMEKLHQVVGQVVSAHLGYPIEPARPQGAPPVAQPVVTQVAQPFQPAAVGSGGARPNGAAPPVSPWEGLGADYD